MCAPHLQVQYASVGRVQVVSGNKSCNVYTVIAFNWFGKRFPWKAYVCSDYNTFYRFTRVMFPPKLRKIKWNKLFLRMVEWQRKKWYYDGLEMIYLQCKDFLECGCNFTYAFSCRQINHVRSIWNIFLQVSTTQWQLLVRLSATLLVVNFCFCTQTS